MCLTLATSSAHMLVCYSSLGKRHTVPNVYHQAYKACHPICYQHVGLMVTLMPYTCVMQPFCSTISCAPRVGHLTQSSCTLQTSTKASMGKSPLPSWLSKASRDLTALMQSKALKQICMFLTPGASSTHVTSYSTMIARMMAASLKSCQCKQRDRKGLRQLPRTKPKASAVSGALTDSPLCLPAF